MSGKKRLLLIDDDLHIQELVRVATQMEGYVLTCADNGQIGLEQAFSTRPDLVILDIMMPGCSGWEVCQTLRAGSFIQPIIMLTAKDEEEDEIRGLQLGADDYITKPFSPRQLLARIQALLRRSQIHSELLVMDSQRRLVLVNDEPLELTPKEFDLLVFLAKQPGRVFTREDLLNHVWGFAYSGTTRTVDEHIKRIRQKLEHHAVGRDFIHTIWGVGYVFEEKNDIAKG
ncbi:MAG: response regulator with CheY-like receiver domain and winged-helix DNA-binding domain [Bacilli bacterium]|nr:response regulator with CheY-like receiver domain and winged-helix DNA-binding domain [Bacilli bacterium]